MDLAGAAWRKSSHSGSNGCVEIAFLDGRIAVRSRDRGGQIAVRSSRDRGGPVLLFTHIEWEAFLVGVRRGEFDLR